MTSKASTPEQYLEEIPSERKEAFETLRNTILKNLPKGFQECMSYGMIGYVVPHSLYPAGYHCDPKLPLPFLALASQKNSINLHHMGLYASPELLQWFQQQYPLHCKTKLDMGKGCMRFKKMSDIPYQLLGELVKKMSVKDWINLYESVYKK
jgi:uncharacterized protein YdhG (YjbR/CyaY superfamily)